jgi:hypothetical protein
MRFSKSFTYTFFVLIIGVLVSCNTSESTEQAMQSEEEFPELVFMDTTRTRLLDTVTRKEKLEPIVANRKAVLASLKPNEDEVIEIDWNVLNDIVLEECFYEEIAEYYWCPEFGNIVKGLEGKTVSLKGYILPLQGNYFVLSANPMASCFFCNGDAGPQTIVDLKFDGPRFFQMDQQLTFKGKLRLNAKNIEELFYVFDHAEVYEE